MHVCVLLNDLPNEEQPALERNHGGTLGVEDLPEEPSWQAFKALRKDLRGLMAQQAGTLSQCWGFVVAALHLTQREKSTSFM